MRRWAVAREAERRQATVKTWTPTERDLVFDEKSGLKAVVEGGELEDVVDWKRVVRICRMEAAVVGRRNTKSVVKEDRRLVNGWIEVERGD